MTIDCQFCRAQLALYGDGELGAVEAAAIETHLAECANCAAVQRDAVALRDSVRGRAPYFRADTALRERLNLQLGLSMAAPAVSATPASPSTSTAQAALPMVSPAEMRQHRRERWLRWSLPLAASLAIVVAGNVQMSQRRADQALSDEIISAHVRSLMVDHIADVASTDQHTVKPWFSDKLDYSPPVHDLATNGYPLTGGRLDYIDHRKVAVLVYRRRLHQINLFVWPSNESSMSSPVEQSHEGYQSFHWQANGMQLWAVSDVNREELLQFVNMLRTSEPHQS